MVARGTQPGPLLINKEGKYLIKARFVGEVREVLKEMGLPQRQYMQVTASG